MSERLCIGCGEKIHPKRLQILPNTFRCVKCSDTSKLVGHVSQESSGGEDTYNTLHVMTEDIYKKAFPYKNYEKNTLDSFTTE